MPQTSGGLTTSIVRTNVRNDLMDLDPSNQRWMDATINREIDRSVDRYSQVAPLYIWSQVPTIAASRLYPTPYAAWFMERVEYPLGQYPKRFVIFSERTSPLIAPPASPASGPAFSLARLSGGSLNGTYQYGITYTVPGYTSPGQGGETTAGVLTSITVGAGSAVGLAGIPTGPYGVTGRNIYRTAAGGSQLLYLASIADNTTTQLTDSTPDGSLGANVPTANTTDGIPQFELQLTDSQLPADATALLEVMAGYKHELDQGGTTIPERHWDVIPLGATAHLLYAYTATQNDNFDYVDGQFRDRVDDTKAPVAWLAQAQDTWKRYHARLQEIKNEVATRTPDYQQWGDKPVRWDRL